MRLLSIYVDQPILLGPFAKGKLLARGQTRFPVGCVGAVPVWRPIHLQVILVLQSVVVARSSPATLGSYIGLPTAKMQASPG
jgi:hypothetical protein